MGNRTTTICDGTGCTAEHDNPVSPRLAPQRQCPGWATVHGVDEKGLHFSYDLCPACVQKMIEVLGLPSAETLHRAQMLALNIGDVPGIELPPPLLPPKMCETCKEPYVGESCYFCPPKAKPEAGQ